MHSNEHIMRAVMAAFERQDVDTILSYYPGDDFTYVDMAQPDRVLRGRADMRAWVGEFWSEVDMTGAEMRLLTLTTQGERIACEFELETASANGDASRDVMRGCLIQRIVDGKIREERLYMAAAK